MKDILKYGPTVQSTTEDADIDYIQLPIEWLKEISLVGMHNNAP